uniref:Putative secreted protein n=1 Tax=Ixodes ricinus TaxID=34613 RepID=A0A6B0U2Q1_IXORI
MTVWSLCAIVITVVFWNSEWMVSLISWSVARSTDDVASSKTSTLLCLSRARARHTNCLCPELKLSPPSEMAKSSPKPSPMT